MNLLWVKEDVRIPAFICCSKYIFQKVRLILIIRSSYNIFKLYITRVFFPSPAIPHCSSERLFVATVWHVGVYCSSAFITSHTTGLSPVLVNLQAHIPFRLEKVPDKMMFHNIQNVISFCFHLQNFFPFPWGEGKDLHKCNNHFISTSAFRLLGFVHLTNGVNGVTWVWSLEGMHILICIPHLTRSVGLLIRLEVINSVGASFSWYQGKKGQCQQLLIKLSKVRKED